MSARCLRCDPPQDHDDLQAHSLEAGHPLCARCGRSLAYAEAGACRTCVERLQQNLADLIDAYEQLPDAAQTVGGSRNVPPGGNFLVLAGPGSQGLSQVRGVTLRSGAVDDSHGLDELAGDPPAVAEELGGLENDWRRAFGHPAAAPPAGAQLWDGFRWHPPLVVPRTPARPRRYLHGVMRQAAAYLQQHAEWAASTHPDGFVEAADTVWALRQRVHGALGLLEPREPRALCTICGAAGEDVALEQGGREWLCPRCGDVVTPEAYWGRLRAGVEAHHAG